MYCWGDCSIRFFLKMALDMCCFIFVLVVNFAVLRCHDASKTDQGVYCNGDLLGLLHQPLFVDYSKFVCVVNVE